MRVLTGVVAISLALPGWAASWKVQYFYDKDDSKFVINDFQFVTEKRGYAAGFRELKKNPGPHPMMIMTEDGGKTWTETTLHRFTGGNDGSIPNGALVSLNGALFGMASMGGAFLGGTIFRIVP